MDRDRLTRPRTGESGQGDQADLAREIIDTGWAEEAMMRTGSRELGRLGQRQGSNHRRTSGGGRETGPEVM